MVRSCFVWCCYDDPYERQCVKIVKKSNNMVRCKRVGTTYIKQKNLYLCEMHYNEYIENKKKGDDSSSLELSEEGSISD